MRYTGFDKAAYEEFKANDRAGCVHMLNLIRLRTKAEYADGRDATGLDAYTRYSEGSANVLRRFDVQIIWRGKFEQTLIGPDHEFWDITFIAQYPSVDAFLSMMKDPDYRAAVVHRQAATEDSRLIRLAELNAGTVFADPRQS